MAEPVLVSIAAALAAKAATSLYELVRRTFAGREDAEAALTAAEGAAPDSAEVAALADQLAAAERADPEFATELRGIWGQVGATDGGVVNQITGTVSGKVVQARDIQGGISF
ncbi:hypothetical protein BLA60_20900 [Actinophytocola xinjiangensis]|uniref:Uncharacterized protein n=1 Tax=Actinophytocola xinjiangensis TaxID=485602 RepID=A0A7Z1AY08_9PSEU|nr:hypothetical protein [Actinophytocola xinjiangensis]OLF09046.1 hypothetical protein BLA60_20900 [Actinophytocola xinjiangensis]